MKVYESNGTPQIKITNIKISKLSGFNIGDSFSIIYKPNQIILELDIVNKNIEYQFRLGNNLVKKDSTNLNSFSMKD